MEGPETLCGYRSVWNSLHSEGLRVPQSFVRNVINIVDPEGTALCRLKRRRYINLGPDFAWHIDGYDKIKPFGFAVHGAIDGYSRKILWLQVLRSNNDPDKIAEI